MSEKLHVFAMSEYPLDIEQKILRILRARFQGEGGEEIYLHSRQIAECFLQMGLLQEAKKAYERLLKIDSRDVVVKAALAEIRETLN